MALWSPVWCMACCLALLGKRLYPLPLFTNISVFVFLSSEFRAGPPELPPELNFCGASVRPHLLLLAVDARN